MIVGDVLRFFLARLSKWFVSEFFYHDFSPLPVCYSDWVTQDS